MSARAKARRQAKNNREYILYSRLACGDCTFCPRHDVEDTRGSHSKWGKKKAVKNYYVTGNKARKPRKYDALTWYQDMGDYTYKTVSK